MSASNQLVSFFGITQPDLEIQTQRKTKYFKFTNIKINVYFFHVLEEKRIQYAERTACLLHYNSIYINKVFWERFWNFLVCGYIQICLTLRIKWFISKFLEKYWRATWNFRIGDVFMNDLQRGHICIIN